MKAMDILIEEHRSIERVLNALETGVDHLERGESVAPVFYLSVADFIKGFADGCHHMKEEGVLFKDINEAGIELQGCPLGVMLAEHEAGRQYTRALVSAAQDLEKGNTGAIRRIVQSSRSYITLLRQHIYKEDNILFPMAADVIPLEKHASVLEELENIEKYELGEVLHEKYHTLVDTLEAAIN